MNAGNNLNSYLPSIIIDVGSDNVKFTQPILNTFSISQLLRETEEKPKEETKNKSEDSNKEGEDFINPNSVFELKEFCHSFPTILGKFNIENFHTSTYLRKNRCTDFNGILNKLLLDDKGVYPKKYQDDSIQPIFDFFAESPHEKYNSSNIKFQKDIIWNGKIQDFSGWKNVIERVGQFGYNKFRFENNLLSNTPLILTQSSINTDDLFNQNEKILEIIFEDYKCPMFLICSQALVNLLSYNKTSGTVIDMGESGTQITTILEGFTQYHDSIYSPFLSGRNLNILNHFENMVGEDFNPLGFYDFELDYYSYFLSKKNREKISNHFFFETAADQEKIYRCYDAFYFYPKIFRNIFLKKNNPFVKFDQKRFLLEIINKQSHKMNYQKFKSEIFGKTQDFFPHIKEKYSKIEEESKNPEENADEDIENEIFSTLLDLKPDPIESQMFQRISNLLDKSNENKKYQASIMSTVIANMESLIGKNAKNADYYRNIYFCGGVLNSPSYDYALRKNYDKIMVKENKKDVILNFLDEKILDKIYSFYKGANYLSKLDNLDSIMISRQDYFEYGKDKLCFNFI